MAGTGVDVSRNPDGSVQLIMLVASRLIQINQTSNQTSTAL